MSERRFDAPRSVLEALDGLGVSDADLANALEALCTDEGPPPAGLANLLSNVSRPPLKYAPFYDDLCELFALEEAELERELARESFFWTFLPGARTRSVRLGPALAGYRGFLNRFAPGARFPRHSHRGVERVLVLEGAFVDDGGRVYEAGDLCVMQSGTAHSFQVSTRGACVSAAVMERPLHFKSRLLRLLGRPFEW